MTGYKMKPGEYPKKPNDTEIEFFKNGWSICVENGKHFMKYISGSLQGELKKVDKQLRQMGMGKLADQGLELLNRAAEDAVKEATPIFVDAVKQMTFNDAKNILMGNESSATTYLQNTTSTALYAKFNPVIKNSYTKVGADKIWNQMITRYNAIPLVKKVNPDLTDYTTNKAMDGVFKMIAVEEKNIRTNLTARSSDLLKRVFALQDKK